MVAGELDSKYNLDYYNQWRLQTTWDHQFEHAKPQVNPEDGRDGYYNVTSYSHNAWWAEQKDTEDTPYWTAIENGAKLRSREAIYSYFKESFKGAKEATCQEINEFAMEYVKNSTWLNDF